MKGVVYSVNFVEGNAVEFSWLEYKLAMETRCASRQELFFLFEVAATKAFDKTEKERQENDEGARGTRGRTGDKPERTRLARHQDVHLSPRDPNAWCSPRVSSLLLLLSAHHEAEAKAALSTLYGRHYTIVLFVEYRDLCPVLQTPFWYPPSSDTNYEEKIPPNKSIKYFHSHLNL